MISKHFMKKQHNILIYFLLSHVNIKGPIWKADIRSQNHSHFSAVFICQFAMKK